MVGLLWEHAKMALADALDQPPAERAAFVQARCPDPEIRAEVLALLREFEAAPDFLETPPSVLDALGAVQTADPRFKEAMAVISTSDSPFADLAVEPLEALLAAMDLRVYDAGDLIIRQGDPGDYVLRILSGRAEACVRGAPAGRKPVGEFGPGDVVGEMGLITYEARTADVRCRSSVRALSLPAEAFDRVSERHPEVRMLLTHVVADRLGRTAYDGLGGKDIHGYRIARCVGRGGMGVVYEATRLATGETVALKMMNHRLLYQPGALLRFRREAATLRTLSHASIPRVFECFEAYRTQFLSMQFCEGTTLAELIGARGPFDEATVRRVVGQLAVALQYVHRHDVVHRDLKPSNVMIDRSGGVHLLDFGIVTSGAGARAAEPDAPDRTRFIGTPRYMAPEQFSSGRTDHRVDYYGLACVAYEALTGHPAIAEKGLFALIRHKLRFAVPPASAIGAGVSAEMHEALSRGFECVPEKRTLDLAQLAAWAGAVDLSAGSPRATPQPPGVR